MRRTDAIRQGFREGLADLRSRLYIAGMLCGLGVGVGAMLLIGTFDGAVTSRAAGLSVACLVIGITLFSLPSRER